MLTLAHIVNPTAAGPTSDLAIAQPITWESMRVARELAQRSGLEIRQFAVQVRDETLQSLPPGFSILPALQRTVCDLHEFALPRRLPLLRDILDRLYEASGGADYLIYTNADIALQPHFYWTVARMLEQGHDALVINRRTIPANWQRIEDLPHMWAHLGESHIGHDCFVFPRSRYPAFELGDVCIGVPMVGRLLLWNLIAGATSFLEMKEAALTFHLGAEKPWKGQDYADYAAHNHQEALAALGRLTSAHDLLTRLQEDFPTYLAGIALDSMPVREIAVRP